MKTKQVLTYFFKWVLIFVLGVSIITVIEIIDKNTEMNLKTIILFFFIFEIVNSYVTKHYFNKEKQNVKK